MRMTCVARLLSRPCHPPLPFLLQTARRGIYSKLWAGIQRFSADDPSVLSQDEHVQFEKVKRGGYAYIMDRTPLTTYSLLDSNCTVVVLGCHFMQLPFGIGLQKGSPYRSLLLTR